MARLKFCRLTLVLFAVGLLAAPQALADMRILGSNVARYPRDALLKGNAIDDLKRGEWVRVLMLETNKTWFFGDPPVRREPHGTRAPRQSKE